MTGWIVVALVAIALLLVGVTTLRRRLGRTRQREGATSTAGHAQGPAQEATLVPAKPAETKISQSSADATPDLGLEVLEHLRRLEAKASPGLAAQVVEIFLQDTATRLKALREAVARRDGEAAYRVAHTLQGSASMVGAASVASSCAELVKAARSGSFDRCEAIVADLDAGFEAIQRAATG